MDNILIQISDNEINPAIVEQEILTDLDQTIVHAEIIEQSINAVIEQIEINVVVNSWQDGQSAFVYIARASDPFGNCFTLTFDPLLKYIAILNTTTQITPVVWDFAWLRVKYVWNDGQNGTNGTNWTNWTNGTNWLDWASAYVYIAYASDDQGTDFTLTFDQSLNYIAILNSTTQIVSPVVWDFVWLWKNYWWWWGTSLEERQERIFPYSYCFTAPAWSLETDAVWNWNRLTIPANWDCTISTLLNVKWSDRLTLPF